MKRPAGRRAMPAFSFFFTSVAAWVLSDDWHGGMTGQTGWQPPQHGCDSTRSDAAGLHGKGISGCRWSIRTTVSTLGLGVNLVVDACRHQPLCSTG